MRKILLITLTALLVSACTIKADKIRLKYETEVPRLKYTIEQTDSGFAVTVESKAIQTRYAVDFSAEYFTDGKTAGRAVKSINQIDPDEAKTITFNTDASEVKLGIINTELIMKNSIYYSRPTGGVSGRHSEYLSFELK